jgi:RNA polymerase sigma factor (sigma-70 family)
MRPESSDPSDEWLIQQYCATRDERYFNTLYLRYAHLVELTCFRFLEDEQESKDVSMMVFEKTLQHLHIEPIEQFSNWLFIVARNACISQLRKRKKRRFFQKNYLSEEKKASSFMENEVEWRLIKQEPKPLLDLVPEGLQLLKPIHRECLLLFFQQKLNYEEIAKELRISVKEVKSHLQNGKRQLKKKLLELRSNQ